MDIVNLADTPPFTTKDGSEIRELLDQHRLVDLRLVGHAPRFLPQIPRGAKLPPPETAHPQESKGRDVALSSGTRGPSELSVLLLLLGEHRLQRVVERAGFGLGIHF